MARPVKTGLDYFPLDTVMDDNVQELEAEHGNDGFSWLIKFWQSAYRTENGEIVFRAEYSRKILAKRADITLEKQDSIIHTCLEVGLLDAEAYKNGILTSSGIRKRLEKVNKIRASERERKGNSFPAGKPLENNRKTSGKGGKVKVKEIIYTACDCDTAKTKNGDLDSEAETIYTLYPYRDANRNNASTGKSSKNKLKIKSILKSGYPLGEAINKYLDECKTKKIYLKNFSTFLNNLPDQEPETKNPEPTKPVIDQNPWAKIRREAQQEGAQCN